MADTADPFSLKYDKYSLKEKEKLAKLCFKIKEKEAEDNNHWNTKRKKWVTSQKTFKSRAVREFFHSLRNAKVDDADFKEALLLANRCHDKYVRLAGSLEENINQKFRESGGGRKPASPEVRQVAFEWLVDIKGSLKKRLPRKLFQLKCKELYEQ